MGSMGHSEDISEGEIREMDKKEFRKKFPSGWMEVSRYETLALVLDALLETPATREFTTKEIADKAGPTERSVGDHISSLVELGIVNKLEEDREEARYTLNNQSPITQKLYELNETVNLVKHGEIPTSVTEDSLTQRSDVGDDQTRFKDSVDNQESGHSPRGYILREGATEEYAH